MEFDCFQTSSFGAHIVGIVGDHVSTCSDPGSVGSFRFMRSVVTHNPGVGDHPTTWDLVLCDPEAGICTNNSLGPVRLFSYALKQVANLIRERETPYVFVVGVFDELAVFHLLACFVVSNSICFQDLLVKGKVEGVISGSLLGSLELNAMDSS